MFEELGCYTIDTDSLSRTVMAKDGSAYGAVIDAFGLEMLNMDGGINRAALRKIIFSDSKARKKLENITHPAILAEEAKLVGTIKGRDSKAVILTQAALSIETGAYRRFEGMVVVYCDPDVQLRRLMARDGISKEEAEKITAAQMRIDEKVKYADFVVDNSGDIEKTRLDVQRVYNLIILMKEGQKLDRRSR
jgi:dephospho-CoA kinase